MMYEVWIGKLLIDPTPHSKIPSHDNNEMLIHYTTKISPQMSSKIFIQPTRTLALRVNHTLFMTNFRLI